MAKLQEEHMFVTLFYPINSAVFSSTKLRVSVTLAAHASSFVFNCSICVLFKTRGCRITAMGSEGQEVVKHIKHTPQHSAKHT